MKRRIQRHRSDLYALPGSRRLPLPGATLVGPADPGEQVGVTMLVRSADDLAPVEAFARAHALDVVATSPERRSVLLEGRSADACTAFGVELNRYDHPHGGFRGRTGEVFLPAELGPRVRGVFGLDDRPQARPQFRIADPADVTASFTPVEIAALYRFPGGATGSGQCIGLIELGGGYVEDDVAAYFEQLGLTAPGLTAIEVDGGRNAPTGDPGSADGEVMLDIEVAGAIAPAARIAVYFAPNTDRGFIDAVTTAVHDREHAPSVISISWGGPESSWTGQAQQALDEAFADAAGLGITVCVAAGDNGATDGVADGRAHVDFPASSPHALACGGTQLRASGAAITSETVWNDGASGGATGGGISDTFALPSWQQAAGVPASVNSDHRVGRGVPDVAGNADPTTGYQVEVDGQRATIGGTSAVAPLWAALVALLNEELGKPVGYVNSVLYGQIGSAAGFGDVTSGDNIVAGLGYRAGPGWDACTGLGSPDGRLLLAALAQSIRS